MSSYLSVSVDTQYVDGPTGERFAYRRFGRAGDVPLVLLTRFRGTMDHWDPDLLDRLATERELVVFDNRGTGASSGSPPDSVEGLVNGALACIRSLGLDEIDLLGWSMGATIAQGIALAAPDLTRRLVMAAGSPGGVPHLPPQSARVQRAMGKPVVDENDLLYLLFSETGASHAAGVASLRRIDQRLKRSRAVVGPEAVRAQLVALSTFKGFWDRQQHLRLPVLLAHGVQDVVLHPYASYAMSQRINGARTILYSDAGHGFLFQHAEDFARQVKYFLA
ncbi:alpha/beta fold hydrolase [Streptomyces massasporeus]|uniref:alpha/beta fold hydrolase n=1 Tax=Streptomyces massasporeus TaxID=67324 RepID=UPI0037994991